MAESKLLTSAKECYEDVKEAWRENHARMLEDLRFSNPADPQQWDADARALRKNRVCLTMDRTNQYIGKVVNDARMNKPAINCMPVDSRADIAVATALDGIIRHIEYRSRAQIAYDWAIEGAARPGVGWLRVIPRVVDPQTNLQEICIDRVPDHLSIIIDGEAPDGSDAMNGFAESMIPKKRFKRMFPKAKEQSWDGDHGTWTEGDKIRICEWQYVEEKKLKRLALRPPDGGQEVVLGEDDYRELVAKIGYEPQMREFEAMSRTVHWCKFNGQELLEETTFPGIYIGMVPVIGYEAFVEGKRYICGLTRRLIDSQRAYNYERSAGVESVALQPKAPVMVPAESTEGHEEHWKSLNQGQPAYLPYNALDAEGRQLPMPQRLSPPAFPQAFVQMGQIAVADMESAVGMYQAVLGQPNNATSGKQERERVAQGAVATFHFADNQARSIEHLGRIVVGMIPSIYDTKRQAKILGLDGQQSSVEIDPELPVAATKRGNKVVAINPTVGQYDVRVKTGPSYTTQREEAAEAVQAILQAAPETAPVLVPELARMRDWPNSEKIARALTAMAPPPVQAIMGEDENSEEMPVPPQVQAQIQQMQQQMDQMAQMLDAAEKEVQAAEADKASKAIEMRKLELQAEKAQLDADLANKKIDVDVYNAETARLKLIAEQDAADTARAQDAERAERDRAEDQATSQKVGAVQEEVATLAQSFDEVIKALQEVRAQSAQVASEVAQKVDGSEVVSVEKIRGPNGQMVAARLTQADGNIREVTIQ